MANYYRQFCGILEEVTDDEWKTLSEWVAPVIQTPNFSEKKWRKLLREQPWRDKEHDELCCNFTVERDGAIVYLGTDEYGDVDALSKYVQAFLKKHRTEGYYIMGWADTCDKSRPNGFGGGAVLVTTREISFINSYTWIDEQVKKLKAAKRLAAKRGRFNNMDAGLIIGETGWSEASVARLTHEFLKSKGLTKEYAEFLATKAFDEESGRDKK